MANHTRKENKSFNFQHCDNHHVNQKTSTPLKAQVSSAASCSEEEDDESDEDDDDDEDESESSLTPSTFSS